jgi:hypothetical protein
MEIWDAMGEIPADELPNTDVVVKRRIAAGANAFQLHLVRNIEYDADSRRFELTIEPHT